MKRIALLFALFSLLACAKSVQVWACSITQSSASGFLATSNPLGQSWTAPCSGTLTSVSFMNVNASSTTGVLKIYSGDGVEGTLLASQNISIAASNWATTTLTSTVNITSGQVYTFHVVSDSTVTIGYWNAASAGGRAYYNNTWYANKALEYSVVISSAPVVATTGISSISSSSASSGGNVTSAGGASVTAYGVCWNTTGTPTISDSKTIDGSGTGAFTSSIANLTASTTYYVRAYATNSIETGYGEQVSFTTSLPSSVPVAGHAGLAVFGAFLAGAAVQLLRKKRGRK